MFCYSCGKENRDGAKFCKFCGTKMPIVNGAANNAASNANAAYQQPYAPQGMPVTPPPSNASSTPSGQNSPNMPQMPNISMPQIPVDALTNNKNVKKVLKPKKCTDMRLNIIFGVGHVVLALMLFLPWFKAGIVEFNLFAVIKQLFDSIAQGGASGFYIASAVLIAVGAAIIILSSIYGAIMRFAKSYSANISNIAAAVGCVIVFIGGFVLGISGTANAVAAINPVFGLYATFVLAVVLSVLGSGFVDLQKHLNKAGAPRR